MCLFASQLMQQNLYFPCFTAAKIQKSVKGTKLNDLFL